MRRALYGSDHEAYRETVREFLAREVVPYQHDWDQKHMIERALFARAAKAGIYALQIDERFGGAGEHDYRYRPVPAATRRLRLHV
jgi:alkylation response protein AidB-like acyl-CoA dehydrogenase